MTDASDHRRNSLWLAPTNLVMPPHRYGAAGKLVFAVDGTR